MKTNVPELLSPAGDASSLRAAVCGGADAVYFGASAFNARARAVNFDGEDIRAAVSYCHDYGRKAYVTMNTAIKDRELSSALSLAASLYEYGVDAVISADAGLISLIRRYLPDLEVHISTQAGVCSVEGARAFAEMGAERVVLARELSVKDISKISSECGIQTETFVHGALCVSVSGRCLFSSMVGGRSGNRGECAQPCRLPYNDGKYLLSLKDLSLAGHIGELCDSGTASLKIEGRLKSPDYVYRVTRIYRALLDARRNATPPEVKELESIFSRGGFTDGYFTGKINVSMNGVRGELQGAPQRAPEMTEAPIPLKLSAAVREGLPLSLRYETEDGRYAEATGPIPQAALSRPMSESDYLRPLCALGTTPFTVAERKTDIDEGLMLPVSALKEARREAIATLRAQYHPVRESVAVDYSPRSARGKAAALRSASFLRAEQIGDSAKSFFDVLFLPADRFDPSLANGASLPPVTHESDAKALFEKLEELKRAGCKNLLVSDIGQLRMATEVGGFAIHTDLGFNAFNGETVNVLKELGASRVLSSPELNLPAAADLGVGVLVYGRVPLMVLKKCIGKELIGCDKCKSGDGGFTLTDRKGISFPGVRLERHGSILFNSLPTYMGDKQSELQKAGIRDLHFLFTTETPSQICDVIDAFSHGEPLGTQVRRI